jgi:hypothetical protein
MLVSITSEFKPARELLASQTSYVYHMISTYVIGRLEAKIQYFLCTFMLI